MVKQKKRTSTTQSGKNCAINCAIQGARLILKQKIWLILTKSYCLVANQKREIWVHCIWLTLFCTVYKKKQKNSTALSQSESRIFFVHIIRYNTSSYIIYGGNTYKTTPFAVHYEKIRIHLRELTTNSAKMHSWAPRSEHLHVTQIQ